MVLKTVKETNVFNDTEPANFLTSAFTVLACLVLNTLEKLVVQLVVRLASI